MATLHEVETNKEAPSDFRLTRGFSQKDSLVPITKRLLGGKGVALAEATALGLPVPPGFTITTEAWHEYHEQGKIPESLWTEVSSQLAVLEKQTQKTLGNPEHPLFVSVRSGAPVSMPGIMKTILNVGINDETIGALEQEIGKKRAWRAYCDLVVDLATTGMGLPRAPFDEILQKYNDEFGTRQKKTIPLKALHAMVGEVKDLIVTQGNVFPKNPLEQIRLATQGVFDSWSTQEAALYREHFAISDNMGSAVNIQTMVWGNSQKEYAGSGVLFSRDPLRFAQGARAAFAPHAQGTAVVGDEAGQKLQHINSLPIPPSAQQELDSWANVLAAQVARPVEIEFTYDGTRLWFLQSREARLSDPAWLRFLLEKVRSGKMNDGEAQRAILPEQLQLLTQPDLDPAHTARARVLSRGITITMGNAAGLPADEIAGIEQNPEENFLLVKSLVTSSDFVQLPPNVKGVIAGNGGGGSHIAGVASRIGVPVIFSADTEQIALDRPITLDATRAIVYEGQLPQLTNGENKLLGDDERKIVEEWLSMRKKNPWKFLTTPDEEIDSFVASVRQSVEEGRANYVSPKAIEALTVNNVIPEEIRINYTVLQAAAQDGIRDELRKIIREGHDATVRTCFGRSRRGPWAVITNEKEIEKFLTNPDYTEKYGGYSRWIKQEGLTEVLVGDIPKDKLNAAISQEHCTWTLSALKTGEVLLQINPFTSMLRGFEEAQGNNRFITIRARYRPKHPEELKIVDRQMGEGIFENLRAHQFGDHITDKVLHTWWREHKLAARLAAITEVFPEEKYVTPVLEGQARMDGGGNLLWCLVYGMKIDPA